MLHIVSSSCLWTNLEGSLPWLQCCYSMADGIWMCTTTTTTTITL